MNILSLNFFKLLRLRITKLKAFLLKRNKAKKELEQDWGGVDVRAYTMVEQTPGGRKSDLLTSVHMGSRQLDSARNWQKTGRARWHRNNNEQQYRPREIKIDPQLEYVYDELGLSKDLEQTTLGSSNQVT